MAENSSELAKTHRFKKLNKLQRGTLKENLCQDTLQLNFCKIKTIKNLENSKRKMTLCREKTIGIRDFSSESTELERNWHNLSQVLKQKTVNSESSTQ